MADVTIIGAGITGLSCAWTLKKLGIDAVILESASRPGGVIRTEKVDHYLVECGPNSIQAAAPALELVNEVGLWDDVLPPNPNTSRFIYWDGKLRKFPFGPLSYSGILRALREPLIRSKSRADESVRDFFTRRLGAEVHDRLVGPALTGIYAANTANLSMAAVFPRIVEMETQHGSLLRAFLKSLRGKRAHAAQTSSLPKPKGSMFSFPHGLDTLPKRLAERLDVKYNVKDAALGQTPITIIATPAHRAADLVEGKNPDLAALLNRIEYAPMVIATVSLPDYSLTAPLHGFGFLAARNQGLHLLGALFSSALFPDRAPKGQELLTCFIGGMFEPEAIQWTDEKVLEIACSEIKTALGASEMPRPVAVARQLYAIPQYNIGHERWVGAVKDELNKMPGVFLTGNYLEGVSVPACIEQGDRTARLVAEYVGRTK
jgi:oxygen-dependent protoporphyrinogen oxidase